MKELLEIKASGAGSDATVDQRRCGGKHRCQHAPTRGEVMSLPVGQRLLSELHSHLSSFISTCCGPSAGKQEFSCLHLAFDFWVNFGVKWCTWLSFIFKVKSKVKVYYFLPIFIIYFILRLYYVIILLLDVYYLLVVSFLFYFFCFYIFIFSSFFSLHLLILCIFSTSLFCSSFFLVHFLFLPTFSLFFLWVTQQRVFVFIFFILITIGKSDNL